jgi:hypothetical protein
VKISWKFLLKKEGKFINQILMKISCQNLFKFLSLERWPHGCVSTVSVITHSLMLRVLNTLNGRCAARPIRGVSSPVERLIRVCLRWATMAMHEWANIRYSIRLFYLTYMSLATTNCPFTATMHVGVRSTWLNSEALSRDKDLFFEKKRINLFNTVYSRINALNSKGILVLGERIKFYWKKILEKKFWKKFLKYFSKEKSSELSHVERTPTCIGADTGGWVSVINDGYAYLYFNNFIDFEGFYGVIELMGLYGESPE